MKHKDLRKMLNNPDHLEAEDIAQYAIFENELNDNDKFLALCDLIVAYGHSSKVQGYDRAIKALNHKQEDF